MASLIQPGKYGITEKQNPQQWANMGLSVSHKLTPYKRTLHGMVKLVHLVRFLSNFNILSL